jgi:hypothetical protein
MGLLLSRGAMLLATVSERALIRRLPMLRSSAQDGISPPRTGTNSRFFGVGFVRRTRMTGTG